MFVEEKIIEIFLNIIGDSTSKNLIQWESNMSFNKELAESPFSSLNEWYRFKFTDNMWIYLMCFPDRDQYTLYLYKNQDKLSEIMSSEKHDKMAGKLTLLYKTINTITNGYVIDNEFYEQIQVLLDNYGVITNHSNMAKGILNNEKPIKTSEVDTDS